MTKREFQEQPGLIMEKDVISLGYARATLRKFVDCGVLAKIKPAGCSQARYQKRQLAQLLEWPEIITRDEAAFKEEPQVLRRRDVLRWTGISKDTYENMVQAGALRLVQPTGTGEARCPKAQVAALLGMAHCV